ncbi:MAG: PKD domain-containing protein, partial [Bacteroidia bacterium]
MKKAIALLLFGTLTFHSAWAQTCTMNISTRKVCLGNTVSFSVSVSGGGTISGYLWNFGNTNTSTQASPIYQYPAAGTFTPSVKVNFSGGGNCVATGLPITVFPLPNAKFSFTTSSSQCFKNNLVCITNLSVPGGSSAPVDSGNFNWDDGSSVFFRHTFGQIFCHSYINPLGGIYSPVLQISDTNGCLSRIVKTDSITIYPKMATVSFTSFFTPNCPVTPDKFTNQTNLSKGMVKKFKWNFGDGSYDTTRWDTLTHLYTKTGVFDATLTVTDIYNCTDSFKLLNAGSNSNLDPLIHVGPSTHQCFRNNQFSIYSANPGAQISWALFNTQNKRIDSSTQNPFRGGPYVFVNCGNYRIRMYVSYPGSTCKIVVDTFLDVYGPHAIIQNDTLKIKEQIQCQIHDTVHFRNPLPYLHCENDNLSMVQLWNFGDAYAPQCTTDTKNNVNVNMNCNWSKDSMHVWHYYTPGKEGCYTVSVLLMDTVRGCWDSDTAVMKLTAPSAHWDSTVNPIRRGVYYKTNPVCIGNNVRFYFDEVLPLCGYDTAWLLPDSACGGIWLMVPHNQRYIDYVYQKTCDSSGWVTYGAIVKNGADNSGHTCYDTAWYHFKIFMLPIKPLFTYKVNSTCQPYTVYLNMVDSIQDSIVKAQWFYQLQSSYLSMGGLIIKSGSINQYLTPPLDSVIHGQTLVMPAQGVLFVSLQLTNSRGCQMGYQSFITLGYQKDIAIYKDNICLGETDTLYDQVVYYTSMYPYWADSGRALANKEKLWWDIGDGKGFSISKHNPAI